MGVREHLKVQFYAGTQFRYLKTGQGQTAGADTQGCFGCSSTPLNQDNIQVSIDIWLSNQL